MEANGVTTEVLRTVDFDLAYGVYGDLPRSASTGLVAQLVIRFPRRAPQMTPGYHDLL